jgi:hypothetical protein
MSFDLTSTGNEQPPAFLTAIACNDWLATVPLTNAVQAQSMFLRQLSLLHRYALPTTERFAILEALRGPVSDAQEDVAKKFAGRPLPLSPPEQSALESSLTVWYTLLLGYLRCFDAATRNDDALAPHITTVAQRTISVFADWQVDLCRGEQLPDAAYWKKLNEIFSVVESLGIAARAVNDPVRHGNTQTSALAAFSECQLLHTACPFELPARHLAWVARWARRWGAKLQLLKAPPEDIRTRAVPLSLDLGSDRPAGYAPRPAPGGRWLDTTDLRQSLSARIALLEQGRAPADMQLGDDVTQPAASQLLNRVLVRWCKGGAARAQERHAASGAVRFIAGFEAVHFHLSGGKSFSKTKRDDATLRREREELETFGQHSHRRESEQAETKEVLLENWEIMDDWRLLDESAFGLRITRPLREGARIGTGQLIAVQPPGADNFSLGAVRWALRESSQSLSAGLQLFASSPRAVGVRTIENGQRSLYREAFLLIAPPGSEGTGSVVVPAGIFHIGRIVELLVEATTIHCLKLTRVLDRGSEFERCAYEKLPA